MEDGRSFIRRSGSPGINHQKGYLMGDRRQEHIFTASYDFYYSSTLPRNPPVKATRKDVVAKPPFQQLEDEELSNLSSVNLMNSNFKNFLPNGACAQYVELSPLDGWIGERLALTAAEAKKRAANDGEQW
ncbi:hypothetical protein M5K25_004085 [Dendrobium thyrsiflorum]|uniref:Uncharacterized protein n=1 Tax=Dendrobium thyrsiflorum TaxID=117978 RepID=A0ABD0VM75_DENTH